LSKYRHFGDTNSDEIVILISTTQTELVHRKERGKAMIITDLNHFEVIEKEMNISGAGGATIAWNVGKNVNLRKRVDIDVAKRFNIAVNPVAYNSLNYEIGLDATGDNTYIESDTFAQTAPGSSVFYSEGFITSQNS
jgi:hypothetical protein